MGHKVYVVGLGPGDGVYLTLQARAALEAADVLCGYTAYVALAAAQFPCKETYATGMREEIERCRWALATAAQGKNCGTGVQRRRGSIQYGRAAAADGKGIHGRGH